MNPHLGGDPLDLRKSQPVLRLGSWYRIRALMNLGCRPEDHSELLLRITALVVG
jgi:hypothetical protein